METIMAIAQTYPRKLSAFIRTLSLMVVVLWPLLIMAQTQQGYVKTRGRLGSNGSVVRGIRLPGTTIQFVGSNAVTSGNNGNFSFRVPSQSFRIKSVTKSGYVLLDPEMLSRQHSYSKDPLVLVLENPSQQDNDKFEAEEKIRRSLERQLQKKKQELADLRRENKVTQEQYRELTRKMYAEQQAHEQSIEAWAERYSKIDYDQIDEENRRINEYILDGELDKADSIIKAKGSITSRLEQYNKAQEAIAREEQELSRRQSTLSTTKTLNARNRDDLAQDCFHRFEIFKMKFDNDSAAYYIQLRAQLDTTNVTWQLEAGDFLERYLADYDKADVLYQRALRHTLAKEDRHGKELADTYYLLGRLDIDKGDYQHSPYYFHKTLEIDSALYDGPNAETARALKELGFAYRMAGNLDLAYVYLNQSKEMTQSLYGDDNASMADIYSHLGNLMILKGNYEEALALLERSLDISRAHLPEIHPRLAALNSSLGGVWYNKGDTDKALDYYNKALDIRKKLYGEEHPDLIIVYHNMGTLYESLKDYQKAEEYFNKGIQISRDQQGDSHPDLAASYVSLGNMFYSQEIYDTALKYYQQALDIYLKRTGERMFEVAIIYNNIANIQRLGGEYEPSRVNYEKALDIFKTSLGDVFPNHRYVAKVLENYGHLHKAMGDPKAALTYYQQSYDICVKILGEDHKATRAIAEIITEMKNAKQ